MLSEALIWQFCWSDENVNIEHHCQGSKWLCVYVFILCVGWARRRFLPVSHHFISSIPPAAHTARTLCLNESLGLSICAFCERSRSAAAASETGELSFGFVTRSSRARAHSHTQRIPNARCDGFYFYYACGSLISNAYTHRTWFSYAFVAPCALTLLFSLYPFFKLLMESDLNWAPWKLSNCSSLTLLLYKKFFAITVAHLAVWFFKSGFSIYL